MFSFRLWLSTSCWRIRHLCLLFTARPTGSSDLSAGEAGAGRRILRVFINKNVQDTRRDRARFDWR